MVERAEIIRDKGTNRRQFFRGQVDKYTWVDVGSSFVMSELSAAFLLGQLEMLDEIADRRRAIYREYQRLLQPLAEAGLLGLPHVPADCASNHHLFHILLPTPAQRDGLLRHLRTQGIHAVFHYVPLHTSPMGRQLGGRDGDLPITEDLAARLVRLPMYGGLTSADAMRIRR